MCIDTWDVGKELKMMESMRERIEALTGWDKEADDILQEISPEGYRLNVCFKLNNKWIEVGTWNSKNDDFSGYIDFYYSSQCEKLRAFKLPFESSVLIAVLGRILTPAFISTARLIVSILSNSITI